MNWEPQAGQLPASATINEHLEAGRYDEAIQLLPTRLQLEPDHVESLYSLGMVYSDRMQLSQAREPSGALSRTAPRGALSRTAPRRHHLKTADRANP